MLRAALLLFGLAACGDDDASPRPEPGTGRWACPGGWVAHEAGGCGPAVLLCAEGGGGVEADCASASAREGPFVLRDDGTIGGGWREPGEPDGPPLETWFPEEGEGSSAYDWTPAAGIGSCSEGWTHDAAGMTCDPNLPRDCEPGAEPLPGARCTATGASACPADVYADVAVEAAGATIVHVDPSADPMVADGSRARPFATIAGAMAAAGDRAWLLLARGTHVAPAGEIGAGRHVVGACAAEVSVFASAPGAPIAVAGAELRGVTARAAAGAGAGEPVVRLGASATLRDAIVEGSVRFAGGGPGTAGRIAGSVIAAGVQVDAGSSAAVEWSALRQGDTYACLVREKATLVTSDSRIVGSVAARAREDAALVVSSGTAANAALSRCVLDDPAGDGVRAEGGGRVVVGEVVLRRTPVAAPDTVPSGIGLHAAGGSIDADRVLVDSFQPAGARAEPGGGIVLRGAVVRGPASWPSAGVAAYGVDAVGDGGTGGTAQLTSLRIENVPGRGVEARGEGASFLLERSEVRGARWVGGGTAIGGIGISVIDGAQGVVNGTLVADSEEIGINVEYRGTAIVAGTVVRNTDDAARAGYGGAIDVGDGGSVVATRVVLAGNRNGVFAYAAPEPSRIEIADSVIIDGVVDPADAAELGFTAASAILAKEGSTVEARRVTVARAVFTAVHAFERATVLLEDVAVSDTQIDVEGIGARAVWAVDGGSVTARRSTFAGDSIASITCWGVGTDVTLADSVVRDVRPGEDDYGGLAVWGAHSCRVTLDGVLIERAREASVLLIDALADLRDVVVTETITSSRGAGAGIVAAGVGNTMLERVAIDRPTGGGLLVVQYRGRSLGEATATDLFVRDARSSRVRFVVEMDGTIVPEGPPVAYGIHVGMGQSLDVSRAAIHGGGYGFYVAGGSLSLAEVAITGQVDAAGARHDTNDLVFDRLFSQGNATNDVVERDTLPEATALAPPSPLDI